MNLGLTYVDDLLSHITRALPEKKMNTNQNFQLDNIYS